VFPSQIIFIRPEDIGKGRGFFYSDKIINEMRSAKELEVIGISNAMSLACSAVQMSSEIAAVYVKEMCLDYIPLPILQKVGGVFFTLSQQPGVDLDARKTSIEEGMKLSFDRDGQLVVVSKSLSPEKMVPLSLWKLSRAERLKLMASGRLINRAATLALEITKGSISKDPVAIELMVLSSIRFETPEGEKSATTLEIFLRKGITPTCTQRHRKVLSELKKLKY